MSADFDLLSARELRRLVATRQASPVEITRRTSDKVQATRSSLNAFVFLRPEAALEAAQPLNRPSRMAAARGDAARGRRLACCGGLRAHAAAGPQHQRVDA